MRLPPSALALAAVALLVLGALLVPTTRALLDEYVWEPVESQAERAPDARTGYVAGSLVFWALVGAVFAWAAYDLVVVRWGVEPDRRFFLSLLPLLVFGPLFHAVLGARGLELGSVWAYLAAEPLVYLTTAALAVAGLGAGRLLGRAHDGLLFVGLVAAGGVLVRAVDIATTASLAQAGAALGVAGVAAALVAPLARRVAPEGVGAAAAFAVVAGHSLDGATTWLSIRDPFGWGFSGFRESNPLSEQLVETSNGWPFFAVKLALPVLLLYLLRNDAQKRAEGNARAAPAVDAELGAPAGAGAGAAGAGAAGAGGDSALGSGAVPVHDEAKEARLRAFMLFAVFVLGYGPGMSNLMQVVLG